MTHAQALRLAQDALRRERQRIAVQANLYAAGCDTPGTRAAAKHYNDLTTAITLLAQPEQQRIWK